MSAMLIQEKVNEISGNNLTYLSLILKHNFFYCLKSAKKTAQALQEISNEEIPILYSDHRSPLPIERHGYIGVKFDVDTLRVMTNTIIHQEQCFQIPVVPGHPEEVLKTKAPVETLVSTGLYPLKCLHLTDSVHPGYVHLITCQNKQMFKSSLVRKIMRDHAPEMWPGTTPNDELSTAITTSLTMKPKFGISMIMNSDIVACYELKFWPKQANEWIDRKRFWPTKEIVADIVLQGCHVVPKSHPMSLTNHDEWRLSFSLAEMKLAHCIPDEQRYCYLLAKVLITYETLRHPNSIMKTYYLKTTMFWVSETMPLRNWTWDNLAKNLFAILDKLIQFLEDNCLPNYFVPENNMINHLNKDDLHYKETLRLLKVIRQYPVQASLDCKEYSYYSSTIYEDLFTFLKDQMNSSVADYNSIIQTLMRISKRHFDNGEYLIAIEPLKDLCAYLELFENQIDFSIAGWINCLADCYSRVGDLSNTLKTTEKLLKILSQDGTVECVTIGGVITNLSYLHFSTALEQNKGSVRQTAMKSQFLTATQRAAVRNWLLLAGAFYDISNPECHREYAIWLVHYANFSIRCNDFIKAETTLEKALQFIPQKFLTENDIMITPCEINTCDQLMQMYFEAKHKASVTLRYDYDSYSNHILLPTIIWAYYLRIELEVERNALETAKKIIDLFETFVGAYMPHDKSIGMMPLHWYTLLGHCFLKVSDIEKAEYYFQKRYVGVNIDVELNKYHEELLMIYKLANLCNCFYY